MKTIEVILLSGAETTIFIDKISYIKKRSNTEIFFEDNRFLETQMPYEEVLELIKNAQEEEEW